ncbi:MAG: bifunctional riboflavin kinase/FAD synthetase [bacterium]
MRVIRYGQDELIREPGASLTLGTFDGVHLGHRDLLTSLVRGTLPTVVTFEPHPQHVLRTYPDRLLLLTSTPEKLRKLEKFGVQRTVILPFTRELSTLSADEFLRRLLIGEVGMARLVVGFNHSFGRNREGNLDFMRARSQELGFELVVVDALRQGQEAISSTHIRRALSTGSLRTANRFLTSPYRMQVRVIHGEGRGHDLGFPTANLIPVDPDQLIPAEGVYAVRVILEDETLHGVASIGRKETFGENPLAIEVHIFDRDPDLYNRMLDIEWIDYLREQRAFENAEGLIAEMNRDSHRAREILEIADSQGLIPDVNDNKTKKA